MNENVMNKPVPNLQSMAATCFSIKPSVFFAVGFITIITIITTNEAVSQSTASCSLDFSVSIFRNASLCETGNWGGFLTKHCCGEAFNNYLYALARRASQTGKIFLSETEQNECLNSIIDVDDGVMGCGIEKLTDGGGGCSGFNTTDIVKQLGDRLRNLNQSCEFSDDPSNWNLECTVCSQSWEEIRESPSYDTKRLANSSSDICEFAVLVLLTSSRIDDQDWIRSVYKCLGEQKIVADKQTSNDGKRTMMSTVCSWNTGLGILIGVLAAIMAAMVLAACILLKRRSNSNDSEGKDASKELQHEVAICRELSVKEIYAATNNLNVLNFIGQGIAGKVYKGVLSNGRCVAVKHIIKDGYVETFMREVRSLSHVRHPNLVTLLGHCEEEDECFLVYELCSNGNLSEWLFGKDKVLSWVQRLEIAIDSARGLWFLHTYPEGCIVHRDIKPTNILLGDNFQAKLSDFGLSKVIDLGMSYVSSEVRGTFGYVDPEYQRNHHVNSSGDVYSFGIVLLQILSGKRVINLNLKKPMPLDKMAKLLTKGGDVSEFADRKLNEYSKEAFDLMLKLALSCTAHKHQRPSMEQVVVRLEKALSISAGAHTLDERASSQA